MGQYYRPVIETDENELKAIDNYVNGNYQLAKLMEHSWYDNIWVDTISEMIYLEPHRIAWVGDYADAVIEDFPNIPVKELFETAWGDSKERDKELQNKGFDLKGKFLVNHTTHEYINLDKYKKENKRNGYCTHPVPLLTAIGNGQGGGDFYTYANKEHIEDVGKWAWNVLEIVDQIPPSYNKDYKEVMYHFIEE